MKKTQARGGLAAAFTLVEMLIVVTIVTIMLSVGAVGLKNLSKGGGVSAAVPLAESIFAQARDLGVSKGASARVLINADQNDHEKYLRYMIVAYEYAEDDDSSTRWVAESRGVYLPKGVYFSQQYSSSEHSEGGGSVEEDNVDLYGGIDDSSANTNLSGNYFVYEFNAEGNSTTPGASFVVNAGSKAQKQAFPRVTGNSIKGFDGFIIWKKGTTSGFRHPDQLGIPSSIKAGSTF
ncbi:MAG: pilus assembly FimT family protein [Akkermansiaceae bacterium]